MCINGLNQSWKINAMGIITVTSNTNPREDMALGRKEGQDEETMVLGQP